MKPIIGISVDFQPEPGNHRLGGGKLCLNWNYAQAVADAGGIPILIPPQSEPMAILGLIDGLLIPGGNDIDAKNWGEQNHPSVEPIAEERFEAEKRLYESAPPDLPVLGICYGCQFLNVIGGGSLLQHIPDEAQREVHTGGVLQTYELEPDSRLAEAIATLSAKGQSWHHQAIRETGENLRVVAKGEDGTIEAVEANDRPWVVGVQWHPERTPDDPATQNLFASLIHAAQRYHERRNAPAVR